MFGRWGSRKTLLLVPIVLVLVVFSGFLVLRLTRRAPIYRYAEAERQLRAEHLAAWRAAETHGVSPVQGITWFPTPTPAPTPWSPRITEQVPPPWSGASMTNAWLGDVHSKHVIVFAGVEGEYGLNPLRGLIVEEIWSPDHSRLLDGARASPPIGVARLRIVSFEGALLKIEATTGETFYFDANAEELIDAAGVPVPTDVPLPPAATPSTADDRPG